MIKTVFLETQGAIRKCKVKATAPGIPRTTGKWNHHDEKKSNNKHNSQALSWLKEIRLAASSKNTRSHLWFKGKLTLICLKSCDV